MHSQQLFFVSSIKNVLPEWFVEKTVLELGSLDINGSVRPLFDNCSYIGIDVGPGPGVDRVCKGQDFEAPASSYDVVISCEMMEHNPQWRETWLNMLRLMKTDGMMIMTCATYGRLRHGTPDSTPTDSPLTCADGTNYYCNLTERDFLHLTGFDSLFSAWRFFVDNVSHDLYFLGVGRNAPQELQVRVRQLFSAFNDYYRRKDIEGRQ